MGRPYRHAAALAFSLAAGWVAWACEPAVMRNRVYVSGDRQVAVGAVRIPLWSAAFAQTPDTVTLEDLAFAIGNASFRAKQVILSGVGSPRAEVEAIFDKASPEAFAPRLAKITAQRVRIPELVVEQETGPLRQRTVYREVVLTDVAGGRVRQMAAESATAEASTARKVSSFTQGRLTIDNLNLADLARIYVERTGSQGAAMTKVYGGFLLEDLRLKDGEGHTVTIARIKGAELSARPTEDSWAGTMSLIGAMADIPDPSAEDGSRLVSAAADLLAAIEVGPVEATGIAFAQESGEATGRIARISYRGATAGEPADARVEGFELAQKDSGRARIEAMVFTGFSFRSTLDGLKAVRGRKLEDLDADTLRRLVPTIGTVRLSGLDFDVPNKEFNGTGPERIRFTLKDFGITLDKPYRGIPTEVRIGLKNLAVPLPETSSDSLRPLLDLGYRALDVSFQATQSWEEQARQLHVKEISVAGSDMGSVSLSAELGNVGKELFGIPGDGSYNPLLTFAEATARSLHVTVENNGLFERYIALDARRQKKTPEAVRKEYGAAASLAVPIMLGNSAQAKALGQAVARFIAKPGRLVIEARAKQPAGLPLLEIAGTAEPSAILERIELTARVEERP
jgi:hypothetical protein